MRILRALFSTLLSLALTSSLAAQTGDWQVVQNLSAETPIVVKLQHVRGLTECWFQTATDDNLSCDRDDRVPHRVTYRRDEIRKVYLKPEPHLGQSRSPWFAAPLELTAGAAGSVLMLRHFPNGPAAVGLVGFVGGASITALIVHHFNHGQLIYRSSVSSRRPPKEPSPASSD